MTGIMAAALSRQNFILPHLFPETTSLEAKCKLNCCKQIREIKENIPIDENNLPNHVNTRKLKNESLKCNHISFEITRASTFFSISSMKYLSLLQWFLLCALYFLVSLSANQHWDPGGVAGQSVIRLGQWFLLYLDQLFPCLSQIWFLLSLFQWLPSSLFLFLLIIIGMEEAAGRSVIRLGQWFLGGASTSPAPWLLPPLRAVLFAANIFVEK